MNVRSLCRAALSAALALALLPAGCGKRAAAAKAAAPRNLLLITVDGLDAGRMGCYASPARTPTPVLDGLALAGVLIEDARAASTLSLPAHLALFSGAPQAGDVSGPLDGSVEILAPLLQAQGYRTAAVVANPALASESGISRGFEIFDAPKPRAARTDGLMLGDAPRHRAARPAAEVTRQAGDLLFSALAAARQDKAAQPWFLWVNFVAAPGAATPDQRMARFFPDSRDAAIAGIDEEIGKLFQVLEMADAKRDTLVAVAGCAPPSSFDTSAAAYRVPLLLARKATLPAGKRLKTPLSLCDLSATLAGLLGARPAHSWRPEQNLSASLLAGAEPSPRPTPGDNPLPAALFGGAAPAAERARDALAVCAALRSGRPVAKETVDTARLLAEACAGSATLAGWHGVAALAAGDPAAAETAFRRALAITPGSVAWSNNLALALCSRGQMPQGLDMLDKLHDANPSHPEVFNNLIRLLLFAGDKLLAAKVPADALTCYSRVVQIAPDVAAAHTGCGRAHEALGNRDAAAAAYRQSLKLNPRQAAARKAPDALGPAAAQTDPDGK